MLKAFLLLAETTSEILWTTFHSYLKIVLRKNVLFVLNETWSFSLQYCTFSSTTMSSRSLPSRENQFVLGAKGTEKRLNAGQNFRKEKECFLCGNLRMSASETTTISFTFLIGFKGKFEITSYRPFKYSCGNIILYSWMWLCGRVKFHL